jgi:hypothetical protein
VTGGSGGHAGAASPGDSAGGAGAPQIIEPIDPADWGCDLAGCGEAATTGHYRPERLGKLNSPASDGLVFYRDEDVLYDFDTSTPGKGLHVERSAVDVSSRYSMSKQQSLVWQTGVGGALTLDARVLIRARTDEHTQYRISLGLFQESVPRFGKPRVFDLAFIDQRGRTVAQRTLYLHRPGWNVVLSESPVPAETALASIRITQTQGVPGTLYLDNVMLYLSNGGAVGESYRIFDRRWASADAVRYPAVPLTPADTAAFATIVDRALPAVKPAARLSDANMTKYREFHRKLGVTQVGEFANGLNPLTYNRAVPGDTVTDSSSYVMWKLNGEICSTLNEMGRSYAATQDAQQKTELAKLITDIVRLAVTYGGFPSSWYNGRGFADGVFYAREALRQANLLDAAVRQIRQEYGIDERLYADYSNAKPGVSADDLNTNGRAIMLGILSGRDTPEKARDLRRLSAWVSGVGLGYAPGADGTLKPDGSWFHHWGNRFDNYGWTGAWRGATEYVYWLSGTPFRVHPDAHERMLRMARVRYHVIQQDGYVGAPDNMWRLSSEGLLNLVRAGTPDGKSAPNRELAAHWMYYNSKPTPSDSQSRYAEYSGLGIRPAAAPAGNHTFSYAGINVHRRADWAFYTHAVGDGTYYTQYERSGFLFYAINGLAFLQEGVKDPMVTRYGASVYGRHGLEALTPGFSPSRAPGVTAIDTGHENLRQLYYQSGSSKFVGGVSTQDGNGMFASVFDGREDSSYAKTVAASFRVRKSYMYFEDEVVSLASGIGSNQNERVQTGLFQEELGAGDAGVTLGDGTTIQATGYRKTWFSSDIPWLIDSKQRLGFFLPKGQSFTVSRGTQTFGATSGSFSSAWLEHGAAPQSAGYEYVILARPSVARMTALASAMTSATPRYRILRKDERAHIVQRAPSGLTGYALFDPTLTLNGSAIATVSAPCVLLERSLNSGARLRLAVADPVRRTSGPVTVTVRLRGAWRVVSTVQQSGLPTRAVTVRSTAGGITELQVSVSDGLTTEFTLEK